MNSPIDKLLFHNCSEVLDGMNVDKRENNFDVCMCSIKTLDSTVKLLFWNMRMRWA